jgi:hypothetical protein
MAQAFTKVEAYITDEDINFADMLALITILETAYRNLNCITTVERK